MTDEVKLCVFVLVDRIFKLHSCVWLAFFLFLFQLASVSHM